MKPLSQRIIFVRPQAFSAGALLVSAATLAALATGGCGSGKGQSPLPPSSLSSAAGGSGSLGSSASRGIGGAKIGISWPERPATGRLIPQRTESILIEFFKTDPRLTDASQTPDRWKWVARPATISQTTVSIDNLEARTYFVRVQSLPTKLPAVQPPTDPANSTLEGTGDPPVDRGANDPNAASKHPVGETVGTMTIQNGNSNAHLDATLASTIAALTYSYAPDEPGARATPPLTPNKKYRFSVVATNAAGQQILVNDQSIHWTGFGSFGDAVPSSTTGASITVRFGSNATSVNVTATDFESNKAFPQTFNTQTGTFGQPGAVLGVAGPVTQEHGFDRVYLLPLLNVAPGKDASGQEIKGYLLSLYGTGPSGYEYPSSPYINPTNPTAQYGKTYNPDAVSDPSVAPVPVDGSVYGLNGFKGPLLKKPNSSGYGTYGELIIAGKSVQFGAENDTSKPTLYTATGTIAGFDALDGNIYIGEVTATGFQVVTADFDPATPSQKQQVLPIPGTNPKLVGVDAGGQYYVRSTENGQDVLRRYDGLGQNDDRYGPLVLTGSPTVLIAPTGKALVVSSTSATYDVFSPDGKIRLGSPDIFISQPPANFEDAAAVDSINGFLNIAFIDNAPIVTKYGVFTGSYIYQFKPSVVGTSRTFYYVNFYSVEDVGK